MAHDHGGIPISEILYVASVVVLENPPFGVWDGDES